MGKVRISKYCLYIGSFLIGFGLTRVDGGWFVSGIGLIFLSILVFNMDEFEPGGRLSDEGSVKDKVSFFSLEMINEKLVSLQEGVSVLLVLLLIIGCIVAFFTFVPLVPALLIIIIILLL